MVHPEPGGCQTVVTQTTLVLKKQGIEFLTDIRELSRSGHVLAQVLAVFLQILFIL
jgi:hypothetical protein